MFFFQIIKIILRCFLKDFKIIISSGIDFLINLPFLLKLKKNLIKIQPKIENNNVNKKKILVDCYDNNLLYLYSNVLHAFPIQKFFNANCVIYSSNFSFTKSYLLSVFKNKKIIYIDSFLRNFFVIIKNFKTIKIEYNRIQKIKSQSGYKFDGIDFDNISYDTYLRLNLYGRLKNLSHYKFCVFRSIITYLNIKNLIERDICIYSAKETQFNPRGVIFQACLKNSIKSYILWGPHDKFSVRKYSSFSQRYFMNSHINKNDFLKKLSSDSINLGKKYIEDKFFLKTSVNEFIDMETSRAFADNLDKIDRESLLRLMNLDTNKKTAFIFAHCIYDGFFGSPRVMFQDFYNWLEETILCLMKNDKINIIIKPHPTELDVFNHNSCEELFEKHNLKNINNIKLLSNKFHPTTLLKAADFVISARGTAVAEYSAFGIPCITTDHTPYNYCSFHHNFKNKDQYFDQLLQLPKILNSNIDELKNKYEAYHFLNLTFNKTKNKNPYFAEENFIPKNNSTLEQIKYLKKCIDLIEKSDSGDQKYYYELYENFFKKNKFTIFKN